jgi:hypothetical protein
MTTRVRIAAAPGVRTDQGRGVRAAIGASIRTVVADPGLWLLGALSFSVRGGVLLVLLPLLWVPSPVLLSIFLGRYITTSGLSAEAGPLAGVITVGAVLAIVAAIFVAAYAQLASFERVATSDETASLRGGRLPRPVEGGLRRGLILRLAALNLLGLIPIGVLLGTIGERIAKVIVAELQFPTSLDKPFALTVLGRVSDDLLVLAAVAVVMELLVTLAAHQLLAAHFRVLPDGLVADPKDPHATPPIPAGRHPDVQAATAGIARLGRQPARTLVVGVTAWLITAAAVAVMIVGAILGLEMLRALLFRAAGEALHEELLFIARLLALGAFGAIWVGGITLAGFASSLRGALWTTNTLH